MEEQRFDDLARLVAQKTSRRQVLKVLAGAALGGMFANRLSPALAAGAGGCATYCNQVFGEDTAATTQCIQDAKRGTGLCYTCGPASTGGGVSPSSICCTRNSSNYCTSYSGSGGATCCSSSQTCTNGTCTAVCTTAYQGPCTSSSQCCQPTKGTAICSNYADQQPNPPSVHTVCCGTVGSTCSSLRDCCGTNDCVNGLCACQGTGAACSGNQDCCSQNCLFPVPGVNGYCA